MKETTTLKLFLSTGTLITIYFKGSYDDIGEGITNDLEESMAAKYPYLTCNYTVEQMLIQDGNGGLLFNANTKDEPTLIDIHKIIGWTVEE